MKKIIAYSIIIVAFLSKNVEAQFTMRGLVLDLHNGQPVPGAVVRLRDLNLSTSTDKLGQFSMTIKNAGLYRISVSFVGYTLGEESIRIPQTNDIIIRIKPDAIALSEIQISKRSDKFHSTQQPLSAEIVKNDYIIENNAGNLVKSIEKMAGISSMDIGSGASKPVIRGMGFNRVAVTENGIKQEGQQWGADHGLEIDQYGVERMMVYKGPMSLQYGSDAMGGVLAIENVPVTDGNRIVSDVVLLGKSNNKLFGLSAMVGIKRNRWFTKIRCSLQDYGDYQIPTDTIEYLTRRLPIYNRRLKNTAGNERMVSALIHYESDVLSNTITVSNVFQKNGFFPGAHGIPDLQRIADDGNSRDISFPFAQVNHLKLITNTVIEKQNLHWHITAGLQNNRRQEWAAFHTHYSNQKAPASNPDLELDFNLSTASVQSKIEYAKDSTLSHCLGIASEYQNNKVAGYNFLLPDYNRFGAGLFLIQNRQLSSKTKITGGLRFDVSRMIIAAWRDTILETFLYNTHAYSKQEIASYGQRSYKIDRVYGMMSGSVGTVSKLSSALTIKANVGRSFRLPAANELSSNGVHHGSFRHEQGDTALNPEIGYQFDANVLVQKNRYSFSLSPFFNWFSNYIYLNPTGEWSILPHAGQLYRYSQSKAIVAGGECSTTFRISSKLEYEASAEYVYMQNLTDGYPLPFAPPLTVLHSCALTITPKQSSHLINLKIEQQLTSKQDRIARNEEITPRFMLLNVSATDGFRLKSTKISVQFMVQNLLNTRYYNHLSFYRKLFIPEPGRNIQISVRCTLL